PLLGNDENVRAQVKIGVETYKKHFGRTPLGIWLPECAYRPRYVWKRPLGKGEEFERAGIEEILADYGLSYFMVDTHLLLGGEAVGVYAARFPLLKEMWERFKQQYKPQPPPPNFERDPYVPYLVGTKEKNTAFFTRDEKTGLLVWSKDWGYPGDYNYREFHKRFENSGHRYWRITSTKLDLAYKEPYVPEWAQGRVREHAEHFANTVRGILEDHWNAKHIPGIVVAAYDFELIGGWFYEGPDWLKGVLKRVEDFEEIGTITLGQYLSLHPPEVIISLPEGSWGQGGGHWVWLNEWTTWCWERIYECEDIMKELAKYYETADEDLKRILRQMGRELLLLESSDWEFLITTWSARDYAENRVSQHYDWFKRLEKMARKKPSNEPLSPQDYAFLQYTEEVDRLFGDLDPRLFAGIAK
ncbi:MAG: 1,4-alpha-glucan branching protein domain-containing protein, partial [Thermoproteota archaeon]